MQWIKIELKDRDTSILSTFAPIKMVLKSLGLFIRPQGHSLLKNATWVQLTPGKN